MDNARIHYHHMILYQDLQRDSNRCKRAEHGYIQYAAFGAHSRTP